MVHDELFHEPNQLQQYDFATLVCTIVEVKPSMPSIPSRLLLLLFVPTQGPAKVSFSGFRKKTFKKNNLLAAQEEM